MAISTFWFPIREPLHIVGLDQQHKEGSVLAGSGLPTVTIQPIIKTTFEKLVFEEDLRSILVPQGQSADKPTQFQCKTC